MLEDFIKKVDKVKRTIEIIEKEELPCNWKQWLLESLKDEEICVIVDLLIGIYKRNGLRMLQNKEERKKFVEFVKVIFKSLEDDEGKKESEFWSLYRNEVKKINEECGKYIISELEHKGLDCIFKDRETIYFFYQQIVSNEVKAITPFIAKNIIALNSLHKIDEGFRISDIKDNKGIKDMDLFLEAFIKEEIESGLEIPEYKLGFRDYIRNYNAAYSQYVNERIKPDDELYNVAKDIASIKESYEWAYEHGMFKELIENIADEIFDDEYEDEFDDKLD
jgi:hypothetical protein